MDSTTVDSGTRAGHPDRSSFTRRVIIALSLAALLYFIWVVKDAFLLLFAGIVMATIFVRLSDFIRRWTGAGRMLALWVVVLLGLGVLTGLGFFLFPKVNAEAARINEALPGIQQSLQESRFGSMLLDRVKEGGGNLQWGNLFSQVTGIASGVFNFFTSIFLILFITLFLAANPEWYVNGIIDSFPKRRRKRIREVMEKAGEALWHWLIAQAFAMAIIAVLSTIGLLIVGARFAIVLGLLAGLFQFIPFVGPILWAVPASLLALAQGPAMALKVLAVYAAIQALEGNVITPMVQKHEASVPPVIILLSTVTFGVFFGPMGLILATPLTVVCLVFYQMLYRQDALGDNVPSTGE
jgi:predicted PurR-regulated permease PerM